MGPLSNEWLLNREYAQGDRVAFKVGDTPGAQAFECTTPHESTTRNQPDPNDTTWWRHFPRGFPNDSTSLKVSWPQVTSETNDSTGS